MQLQADLNTASREINRLRDGFVTSIMAAKSRDERTRRIEAADKTDKVRSGKSLGHWGDTFYALQRFQRKYLASEGNYGTTPFLTCTARTSFIERHCPAPARRQRKVPEMASEVMISNRGPPPPPGPQTHIKRRS